MKITFRCTGCGKLLKARPEAAGRTRKCPVCATRVTCPQPVVAARFVDADPVDAEVIEAEVVMAGPRGTQTARPGVGPAAPAPVRAFSPYADEDDDPYQLADPDPALKAPPEAQKPCPMCGETIIASAIKCRHCGEVLDPKLKKGKSKKRRKSASVGGSGLAGSRRNVGIGILCIFLGIGLTIVSYARAASGGGGTYFIYHGLVIVGIVQFIRGIRGG
jgi:predicted RNA-binding Zn-ribbon protein involved in translation (DUF1610 family)